MTVRVGPGRIASYARRRIGPSNGRPQLITTRPSSVSIAYELETPGDIQRSSPIDTAGREPEAIMAQAETWIETQQKTLDS